MAALKGVPRIATVVATEPRTELLVLNRDRVQRILERNEEARFLLEEAVRRWDSPTEADETVLDRLPRGPA